MKRARLDANLRARALTALLVGPLILLLSLAGGLWFLLAVLLAGALGGLELARLPGQAGRGLMIATALAVPAISLAVAQGQPWLLLALLAPALAGLGGRRRPALGLVAVLYVGVALGLLLLLRNGEQGQLWTLVLFVNNWCTDSFAMLGGRRFGRRRLAPAISPGKTVEGALVGLLAGAGGGLALATAGGIPAALALPLNLGVALATTAGDLLESLLKRQWQADDSGSLLPGHGGLLDRMDGTLLAAPVLWLLLQIL